MRWNKYKLGLLGLAWLVVPTNSFAQPVSDWREQNTYTLGVQAYIYTFPWSYMAEARSTRTRTRRSSGEPLRSVHGTKPKC